MNEKSSQINECSINTPSNNIRPSVTSIDVSKLNKYLKFKCHQITK